VQQVIDRNDPLTLEEAEQRLNALLSQAELNAWDVGDLLNKVERRGLARASFGKTKSWVTQRVPAAEGKMSTLYRYANVAANYTKEEVDKWGMAKLECLITHDLQTHGQAVAGDPTDREIQLVQEDGSTVARKFTECTCRELRQSAQARRKATGKAGRSERPEGELGGSRKKRLAHEKKGEVHPLRYSLAAFVLGQAVVGTSFLLPDSELNLWLAILGGTLSLTGVGMLLRHWERARDAVLEAFRHGRGIHFLGTQASRCVQAVGRAVAAVRSRVSARRTQTAKLPAPPGAIPEEPTPPVKKAA
jgi:hypothetical protein